MNRDRTRLFHVFLLVSLAIELLAWGVGCAQDPETEGCLPLEDASLAVVAADLGLDLVQTVWLRRAHAAGGLRVPADLDSLPGAGEELREAIASSLCWGEPARAGVSLEGRTRPEGLRREVRGEGRAGGAGFLFRVREDPAAPAVLRGGVTLLRDRFRVSAGTIRLHAGHGLLLATPGAASRGSRPREIRERDWGPTRTLDPRVVPGIAVEGDGGEWRVRAALGENRLRPAGEPRGVLGALTLQRRRGDGPGISVTLLDLGEGLRGSVSLAGGGGPVTWGAESIAGGGAAAEVLSLSWAEGPWRFGGSIDHRRRGFRAESAEGPSQPLASEAIDTRFEARWLGGSGRHLRLAGQHRREPRRAGEGWPETIRRLEVEGAEQPSPGWRLGWLWRETVTDSLGTGEEGGTTRVLRADLVRRTGGVRWTLRVERRDEGDLATFGWMTRVSGAGRWNWELRSARLTRPDGSPAILLYGRRAGGAYGWSQPGAGTWLGGWVATPRVRRGDAFGRLEASLDMTAERWDAVLALEVGAGGD